MRRPSRWALAALAAGLLWGGPPARELAFAQAVDAAQVDPKAGGELSSSTATAEAPIATAEPDPSAPRADPEASPPNPPAEDAQGTGTNGAGLLEPSADDAQADLPPVGPPSGTTAQLAAWIAATGDNGGRPFVIVDKLAADVFVFAPDGSLQGAAPVLVGETPGDDSAAGVGDRDLGAISPEERTTPAGRFVASFGAASGHRTVLWVDYVTAISLHPVITTNPAEHRLERLRSPAVEDRRITYGCINVPKAFYRDVVLTTFAGGSGVVYILPDTKPLQDVFPAFAVVVKTSGVATEPPSQREAVLLLPSASSSRSDGAPAAASDGQDPDEATRSLPVSFEGAPNGPVR